jgi:hypothetical protein
LLCEKSPTITAEISFCFSFAFLFGRKFHSQSNSAKISINFSSFRSEKTQWNYAQNDQPQLRAANPTARKKKQV